MTVAGQQHLDIDFRLRRASGTVRVTVVPNTDPPAAGCEFLLYGMPPDLAMGYPVCTATVDYGGDGYGAVFGWTQLVRSTDNASGGQCFETDPIAVYRDVDTPFAWYGVKPVLFDAPLSIRQVRYRLGVPQLPVLLTRRRYESAGARRRLRSVGASRSGLRPSLFTPPPSSTPSHGNAISPVVRHGYPNWIFDEDLQST